MSRSDEEAPDDAKPGAGSLSAPDLTPPSLGDELKDYPSCPERLFFLPNVFDSGSLRR